MKAWTWLLLGGGAFAIWWFFVRQRPLYLGPPGVPQGGAVDSAVAYLNDLLSPRPPNAAEYLPPVTPTGPAGVGARAVAYGNQAITKFGDVSESTFKSLCKSGQLCEIGAPIANYAGKATAAVTVKSIEYGAKAAQVVGSTVVSGVKKLKFW